jgi:hypothetical protein
MPSNVTVYDDDDGFTQGSRSRGGFLKWSVDANPRWRDQDGCKPPERLVAMFINERLCRWQEGQPSYITEKPLPDPDELNRAIPQSTWEKGLNDEPRPPWEHQAVLGLVDPASGQKFIFSTATIGGHIACDELRESVAMMRLLRGEKCVPVVELSEKPMKTKYKMGMRPHIHITGEWKVLGGDMSAIPVQSATPQLSGPISTAANSDPTPPQQPQSETVSKKKNSQKSGAGVAHGKLKSKPPVKAADETLKAMADVKPVTTAEIVDDSIPW